MAVVAIIVVTELMNLFADPTQVLNASFCFTLQQFSLRLMCKYVYVCVYMLSQFQDLRTMSGLE